MPWLISSPLFATGLNFEHPPTRLLVTVQNLNDLDTSLVIQTVNRANRTDLACEVRLYAGRIDDQPFWHVVAEEERSKIEGYFVDESEIAGDIDPHFHWTRAAYIELRRKKRRTPPSRCTRYFVTTCIRNYRIVQDWQDDLPRDDEDKELFKTISKAAREGYKAEVAVHVPSPGTATVSTLTYWLRLLRESHWERALNDEAPKDRELAAMVGLTGNPKHLVKNSAPDPASMLRLHAEIPPYLSSQFDRDKSTPGPQGPGEQDAGDDSDRRSARSMVSLRQGCLI